MTKNSSPSHERRIPSSSRNSSAAHTCILLFLILSNLLSKAQNLPRDGFNQVVFHMAYDEPFGIACIGAFNQYHGGPGTNVARLNSYGARISEFIIPSTLPVFRGTIAVVGSFAYAGFTNPSNLPGTTQPSAGLIRLNSSGQPTGNPSTLPLPSEPLEIIPGPYESLYTASNDPDYAGTSPDKIFSAGPLIRFTSDGTRDTNFQIHATAPSRPRMAFDASGSTFWISGGPRFRVYAEPLTIAKHLPASGIDNPIATQLARFNTNGSPIPFPTLTLLNKPATNRPSILTVSRISETQYVVGGQFIQANNLGRLGMFRMHENGEIDPTWNPNLTSIPIFQNLVSEILPTGDGGCLALIQTSGEATRALIRITPLGQLDTLFGVHRFTLNSPSIGISLVRARNGIVFAAGDFRAVDGQPRQRFARFHPDGTLGAETDLSLTTRLSLPKPATREFQLWLDSRRTAAAHLESSVDLIHWTPEFITPIEPGLHPLSIIEPLPLDSARVYRLRLP